MTYPTIHVEVAFGFGPLDAVVDGDFVNLAAVANVKVRGFTIARGRPSEFDAFPPGTCQITIEDLNRVLDPTNASGAYFGQLLPRVPIRVRAEISGVYYPRFYGYVDGWPMRLNIRSTTVDIVATDGFKVLNSARLADSSYDELVAAESPTVYWKLGEEGEVAVDSSTNRYDATYPSSSTRGVSIMPAGSNGSVEWADDQNGAVVGPITANIQTLPITVEMWVQSDDGTQAQDRILMWNAGGDEEFLLATGFAGAPGQVVYLNYLGSDAATAGLTIWQTFLYDGLPHHIVVVIDTSTRELYVDGALVPKYSEATGSVGTPAPREVYIGGYSGFVESFPGRMSNIALYNSALSGSDALDHYLAGAQPYTDTSGSRVTQVLDLVDWPASLRDLDPGEVVLAPPAFADRTALDYLQAIATSEQGRLFMSKDGKVTFHQRDRFITEATENTSQYTFSESGAGDAEYGSLSFAYDDRFVYNEASAQRDGGNVQTVSDPTSVAAYGALNRSLSGLLQPSDAGARGIADYIVYRYKDPQVRAEEWTLQPEGNAADWADIFGLEIGHRVTLEAKPANKGSQFALDLHLEQIVEQRTPGQWVMTFTGSPIDPNADNYLIWGKGGTSGWGVDVWR